jgi:hypothetical protein
VESRKFLIFAGEIPENGKKKPRKTVPDAALLPIRFWSASPASLQEVGERDLRGVGGTLRKKSPGPPPANPD